MSFKTFETEKEWKDAVQEEMNGFMKERLARHEKTIRKEYEGFLSPEEQSKLNGGLLAEISNLKTEKDDLNQSINKLQTERDDFAKKATKYEMDSVKTKVAQEYGLPAKATQLLFGNNEEEIRKNAKLFEEVYRSNFNTAPLASTETPVEDQRTAAFKQMLEQMRG